MNITRRQILIGALVVVICFSFAVCVAQMQANMGKFGSPEATAESAIKALATKNPDKVCAYFTPVPSGWERTRLASLFNNADKIEIVNVKTMLIENAGVAAKVSAYFDMVITRNQNVSTEHCQKTIKLVCIEGKWYVNEPFM